MPDIALFGAPTDARAPGEAREYDVWCRTAASDLRAYAHTGPIVDSAAAANLEIIAQAIASAEAFGAAVIGLTIHAAGIASAGAFGTAVVSLGIAAPSISSAEAFGAALVSLGIIAQAIASAEAFGTAALMTAVPAYTVDVEVGASWRRIRRGRKW